MGMAAVRPMGRAYHSERPVPKRPDFMAAGAFTSASSSRLGVAWKVLIWLKAHGACLDEELRTALLARLDVAALNMVPIKMGLCKNTEASADSRSNNLRVITYSHYETPRGRVNTAFLG
mmetsp:Transcript_11902/g.14867  ORF Transcript_11902/g.14867 Transcript_11902/m.14867 type:complete len:119 (-) Transcript_11902:8-364(-)